MIEISLNLLFIKLNNNIHIYLTIPFLNRKYTSGIFLLIIIFILTAGLSQKSEIYSLTPLYNIL
jgi:hypothetical protein